MVIIVKSTDYGVRLSGFKYFSFLLYKMGIQIVHIAQNGDEE